MDPSAVIHSQTVPSDDVCRFELPRVDAQAASRFYGALGLSAAVRLEADADHDATLLLDCPGLELTICRVAQRSAEAPVILRFFVTDLAATVESLCALGGTVMKPREASRPPHRAVVCDGHGAYLVLTKHAPLAARSSPVSFRSMTLDPHDRRRLHRSLWFIGIGAAIVGISLGLMIAGIIGKNAFDLSRFVRKIILPLCFVGVPAGLISSMIGKVVRRPLRDWQSSPSLNAAVGFEIVATAAWIVAFFAASHEHPLAWFMLAGAASAVAAALQLRHLGRLASLARSPACRSASRRCLIAWYAATSVSASMALLVFQRGVTGRANFELTFIGVSPFVIWIVYYVVVLWKFAEIGAVRSTDDAVAQSDEPVAPLSD